MRSTKMEDSEPVSEENGRGETEFVPTENGKTRSKSKVPLSSVLEKEFQSLREAFTVSTDMLKEIVTQFEKELGDGLEKDFQNIVGCNPTAVPEYTRC